MPNQEKIDPEKLAPHLQKYRFGHVEPTEEELAKAGKEEEMEKIKRKVEEGKVEKRGGTIFVEPPREKDKVAELKEKAGQATERLRLEGQEKEMAQARERLETAYEDGDEDKERLAA